LPFFVSGLGQASLKKGRETMSNQFSFNFIRQHQSFKNVEEMDQNVRAFLYYHKKELSKATVDVLKTLWRYSCKVPGVSYLKYNSIAEIAQISRRTVIRAINKLEEMGIIQRVTSYRPNGKRGINLIIIQPFELNLPVNNDEKQFENNMSPQDDTHSPEKCHCNKNKEINNKHSVMNKNNDSNVKVTTIEELDGSFTPQSVNKEFVKAASPFFGAYKIYDLYKRVLMAYRKSQITRPLDDVIDRVLEAFKTTVFAFKLGKIRTFEGYFYRLLEVFFAVEKRRENRHLLYDFLSNEF
jgi:DNA-binding Lrp family transcriptional regulator